MKEARFGYQFAFWMVIQGFASYYILSHWEQTPMQANLLFAFINLFSLAYLLFVLFKHEGRRDRDIKNFLELLAVMARCEMENKGQVPRKIPEIYASIEFEKISEFEKMENTLRMFNVSEKSIQLFRKMVGLDK